MTSARRQRYLTAMGVETYVRRRTTAMQPTLAAAEPMPPPPVTVEPVSAPPVAAAVAADVRSMSWDDLSTAVRDCRACGLRAGCTQTVFGVGQRTAELLVVGEGPGADEDAKGEPFVGRAGQLLDSMLFAINRHRRPEDNQHAVFIANVVKCRPPNNRDPAPEEAAACRPYLERQIELVQPKLILAVGRIAAQGLLQSDLPISKLRGPLHSYGAAQIPVLVTYHPAYLLRSPREKARAWEDLKRVRKLLGAVA